MSTPLDSSLFVDVADSIGLGNPAIVEKDYFVVQLLKLISTLEFPYHSAVFSGGTALSKSSIKTYRMSEDIDIKLTPNAALEALGSRNAKRNIRKGIKENIKLAIENSSHFSIENRPVTRDEGRYCCFDIRYPQAHQQAPCLRPFIKLEFIESDSLDAPEFRPIQSLYAKSLQSTAELETMACASILETQAEKLLSMLRRTASLARSADRDDDKALIRHVYDTHLIQTTQASDIESLATLMKNAIRIDVARYGNQHHEFAQTPINELRFGLNQLKTQEKHADRYNLYVSPMVYADSPVTWHDAFATFEALANNVLNACA